MKTRLALLLLLPSFLSIAATASTFSVSGYDILLDGQEFEVNGLCYQPTPIGESGAQPPFGDYYTFSTRNQELWDRDFENFRKMGANVIRLYGWGTDEGVDHTAFLDQAYNGGDQPVYVLINKFIDPDTNWFDPSAINALVAEWETIATELASNPAIMGFLIGNEVNAKYNNTTGIEAVNGDFLPFWLAMEQIAAAVKAIAPNKLVSVAITDRPDQIGLFESIMLSLDFWAMQVYRGDSFGTLTTEYTAATPTIPKPLVITEFGYDALDGRVDTEWPNNAELPADAMEALWNELRADDAAADIIAGACVFEYTDEWWKDQDANAPDTQDFGPRWSGPFEDGQGNEEWWGIFRVVDDGSNIDILEPRAMFFRLAAMWNDPFVPVLQTDFASPELEVTFSYPDHLRDQFQVLEMSTDATNWSPIASNSASLYLSSLNPTVSISANVVNGDTQVTVLKDPASVGLTNGSFETGTMVGWTGSGSVTDSVAHPSGTYSLELTGSGGFSVPAASQSFPAAPGDEFNLSGYMYTNALLPPADTFGLFKIVFKDSDGADLPAASISIGQAGPEVAPGAESLPFLNFASPQFTWVFSEAQAVAPENTASVSFFALNVDEFPATMYFDSIVAQKISSGASGNHKVFFRLQNDGR